MTNSTNIFSGKPLSTSLACFIAELAETEAAKIPIPVAWNHEWDFIVLLGAVPGLAELSIDAQREAVERFGSRVDLLREVEAIKLEALTDPLHDCHDFEAAGYEAGSRGVQLCVRGAPDADDQAVQAEGVLPSELYKESQDFYEEACRQWREGNDGEGGYWEGRASWLNSDECVSVMVRDDMVVWSEDCTINKEEFWTCCEQVDRIVRAHSPKIAALWQLACEHGAAPQVDKDIDGDRVIDLDRYVEEYEANCAKAVTLQS